MSKYEPRISGNKENGFYALVVRIDRDGEESVEHCYKGRHFASHKAALKSTTRYIALFAKRAAELQYINQ